MNPLPRSVARLLCLALLFFCHYGKSQTCSPEALTAKYWQYRKNLNKHFVMNDRKPEGCIGNGITRNEAELATLKCGTDLLHGYGIPATSIVMLPNGGGPAGGGMGDRNYPADPTANVWYDPDCANFPSDKTIDGISYQNNPNENDKDNYLEYGSETPHQIGWYLVTLATEYELLRQHGQEDEMQRTLEDIFLALQALRRLDITANCLVKQRYDEINVGGLESTATCDVQEGLWSVTGFCLCPEKYHSIPCPGDGNWHFDMPTFANCPWEPDLSGYSGFFLREDATQEQEGLHDASEDKWNIDLVGSPFAMSQIPPCTSTFSPTCYQARLGNFLSQDQMFSVLIGLCVVKRYIPPTATVVTCDGEIYKPYDIIQKIAKGYVELPQNSTRHIFWPGSTDQNCCAKPVIFGNCSGGNFQLTYKGIELMYNYINDTEPDHNIGFFESIKWGKSFDRQNWYSFAMGCGLDIGDMFVPNKYKKATIQSDKEISFLINDLLHPEEPNILGQGTSSSDDLQEMFREMLCAAPCEGVCVKPSGYDLNDSSDWPSFKCSNTPDWTGQRWEGSGGEPDWSGVIVGRQFNGVDFMALYNLYMLRFPEEQSPFYNPDRPDFPDFGPFLGEDKIAGPTTMSGSVSQLLLDPYLSAPINLSISSMGQQRKYHPCYFADSNEYNHSYC